MLEVQSQGRVLLQISNDTDVFNAVKAKMS